MTWMTTFDAPPALLWVAVAYCCVLGCLVAALCALRLLSYALRCLCTQCYPCVCRDLQMQVNTITPTPHDPHALIKTRFVGMAS